MREERGIMLYDLTNEKSRTRQLQKMLRFLSFALDDSGLRANVTGSYDAPTENAVRHFQMSRNLPADGKTNLLTWSSIADEYRRAKRLREPVLIDPIGGNVNFTSRRGEVSDTNMILQIMLNSLRLRYDYEKIPLSGIYDRLTEDGVRVFQSANGLPESGEADRTTWQRIAEEYSSAGDE